MFWRNGMIKKLRKKFIIIATLSVALAMILLSVIVNAADFISTDKNLGDTLTMIYQNQGTIPTNRTVPPAGTSTRKRPFPQDILCSAIRTTAPSSCQTWKTSPPSPKTTSANILTLRCGTEKVSDIQADTITNTISSKTATTKTWLFFSTVKTKCGR